jgi:hypothetical protein
MLRNCTHFVLISCCLAHYFLVSTLFSNKNEVTGCNKQVRNVRLQNHTGEECPGVARSTDRIEDWPVVVWQSQRPVSWQLAEGLPLRRSVTLCARYQARLKSSHCFSSNCKWVVWKMFLAVRNINGAYNFHKSINDLVFLKHSELFIVKWNAFILLKG